MLYHPRRHWTLASFTPRPGSQHARALGIRFVEQERPTPVTLVLLIRQALFVNLARAEVSKPLDGLKLNGIGTLQ